MQLKKEEDALFLRSNEAASPVVSDVLSLICGSLNLLKLLGSEFYS